MRLLAAGNGRPQVAGRSWGACLIAGAALLTVAVLVRRGGDCFAGFSLKPAGPALGHRALPTAASALRQGDTVAVYGGGSPIELIVVSLLLELGYTPRPLCSKAVPDLYTSMGVEGHILSSDGPLAAAGGLVLADEGPRSGLLAELVRRLAAGGPLSRVALLSNSKYTGGFSGLFSGASEREEAESSVKEACEAVAAEWTVVRSGRLRGGGPKVQSAHSLPQAFYDSFEDTVLGPTAGLDEEVFDLVQRGIRVGEVGGGFFGHVGVPQTNRLAAAMALTSSLALAEAARSTIGVASTESSESFKTDFDWAAAFR